MNKLFLLLHFVSHIAIHQVGEVGPVLYNGFYLLPLHSVFSLHTTPRVIKYVDNTAP